MTDTDQLRIEYVALSDLNAAVRNPKLHNEEGIAASIDRHGFVEPVILDGRTGRLVGGHGRVDDLAARKASGAPPPARVAVTSEGEWLVPTTLGWASDSDEDAEHLLLALNRLPQAGGWQPTGLLAMLDDLHASSVGLYGTGFSASDLDDIMASVYPPDPEPAPPDDGPSRETQGLREVGLMFGAEQHREYVEHLAKLKRAWSEDAAPQVVLRALREAAAGTDG